jgi:hypothetical protein
MITLWLECFYLLPQRKWNIRKKIFQTVILSRSSFTSMMAQLHWLSLKVRERTISFSAIVVERIFWMRERKKGGDENTPLRAE